LNHEDIAIQLEAGPNAVSCDGLLAVSGPLVRCTSVKPCERLRTCPRRQARWTGRSGWRKPR